jgi:proline iminopeptidase
MKAKIRDTEIYFDIDGCGLAVEEEGIHEKQIAFIIHGGPGVDHTSYKPCFSPLSYHLQMVYFDHRGQGRSARGPKETYTLENNVEDMEALRQYLGLEKIILIGSSYGGMVALSYAIKYPQNVSHLIVIATTASCRFLERAQEILAERGTPEQKAIASKLWAGNFENEEQLRQFFQVMNPMYCQSNNQKTIAPKSAQNILSFDAINVAFSGFLRNYNILDELHKITSPTLVIAGRHDWICPVEFSQEIAQGIPNAHLQIFENSGHLIRVDEPQLLLDAIMAFLEFKNH